VPSAAQPPSPTVIGTIVCSALPSCAGRGPIGLSSTPSMAAIAAASSVAFLRSSGVTPDVRS
jgi:hypothetical protein